MIDFDMLTIIRKDVETKKQDVEDMEIALKHFTIDMDYDKLLAAYNKYRMFKGKIV